jgi:DNA polymerase family A
VTAASPESTPGVPAVPVAPGTFRLPDGSVYTVGRDHVEQALNDLREQGDRMGSRLSHADIEGFGLGEHARHLKSVSVSGPDGRHVVVLDPRDPFQHNLIREWFDWAEWVVFHNSPFDVVNLYLNGLWTLNHCFKVIDTLIYSRLATPDERSKKTLFEAAKRHLNMQGADVLARTFKALGMSKTEGFRRFDLDRPIYLQGAVSDVIVTAALLPVVRQAAFDRTTKGHPFNRNGVTGDEAWRLVDREQVLNRRGLWRSCKGLRVDFDFADRYKATNQQTIDEAAKSLQDNGIRPGVGQDLVTVLDGMDEIPPSHPRTKTGLLQADKKALTGLPHPLAKVFRQYKELTHIQEDYLTKAIDLADENGRVHPQLNFLAATTGRSSVSGFPYQQFPEAARGIVRADEGDSLTSLDMSQIEPIMLANISGDLDVVKGYEAGRTDLYTELGVKAGMLPRGTVTADTEAKTPAGKALKAKRGELKIVLLAQMYGEGLQKLSVDLELDFGPYEAIDADEARWRDMPVGTVVPRFAAAKRMRNMVLEAMPRSAEKMQKLKAIGRQYRMIFTVSGRILTIPVGQYGVEAHKAVNYFVQGGAYDTLADAKYRLELAGYGDAWYADVHDELLVSTYAAGDIREILSAPSERLCLLSGRRPVIRVDREDLGDNWGGMAA